MNGLVVDLFAGFGGASLGIRDAIGRDPDIAINHDPTAVAVHAANHPATKHLHGDVWHYAPRDVTRGRPVAMLWASPTCTFFSQAKGGPLDRRQATRVRALAWVVTRWAREVGPEWIFVENVGPFQNWGPLLNDGRPNPKRRGYTFRKWVRELESEGYVVEWRELRACDYGAPTSRRRLFVVARRDGAPVAWPEPTHGPGTGRPLRGAHEVIDWSIPAPSIFDRKKPLVPATCRRIARGIRRFVLETAEPWVLAYYGTSTGRPAREPLSSVTAGSVHQRLVAPYVIPASHSGDARVHAPEDPLRTVTAGSRSPFQLVTPHLTTYYGTATGRRADEPLPTATTRDRFGVVAPYLVHVSNGERKGQAPRVYDAQRPIGTVVAGGVKHGLVAPVLVKHYGGHEGSGLSVGDPIGTTTTRDHHALVTCSTIGDRRDEVAAFLRRHDENGGAAQGQLFGRDWTIRLGDGTYQIADIGMRLLVPRELARAHDFDDGLELERDVHGNPVTTTAQVRLVGNSVPRKLAAAVVSANLRSREVVAA